MREIKIDPVTKTITEIELAQNPNETLQDKKTPPHSRYPNSVKASPKIGLSKGNCLGWIEKENARH